MSAYIEDADFRLYHGDVLEVLAGLPDESVHCVVTSPPYWGLRDYGTGAWDGGDPQSQFFGNCDHVRPPLGGDGATSGLNAKFRDGKFAEDAHGNRRNQQYAHICGKCGARRIDQQLGLEPTPDLYVQNMVAVFREVRRVLRRDGTCWLNIGDSYATGMTSDRHFSQPTGPKGTPATKHPPQFGGMRTAVGDIKPKDLVGIPWRLAFALQADGWYLRSDIIWSKPNPMPESVTDRPTKAHEYVFLLTRSPRYFFDQEAVREKSLRAGDIPGGNNGRGVGEFGVAPHAPFNGPVPANRNVRSVWEIATQPYAQAHFATFPEALVERCVKAGTSERGCCPVCGSPRRTEVVRTPLGTGPSVDPTSLTGRKGMNRERRPDEGTRIITKAEQREYARQMRESPHRDAMEREAGSAFAHYVRTDESGARPLPPALFSAWLERGWLAAAEASEACGCNAGSVPCVVLDPFMGSGTTALVARRFGRKAVGVELNRSYCELAARRLQQLSLLAT